MERHGWILLFHNCIVEQLHKLHNATARAKANDPSGYEPLRLVGVGIGPKQTLNKKNEP